MKIPENIRSSLTDREKEMIDAARTPAELLKQTKAAGRELTAEEMEAVSGGVWTLSSCPHCGSTNVSPVNAPTVAYFCNACKHGF